MYPGRLRQSKGPQWRDEVLDRLGLSCWEDIPLTNPDTLPAARPPAGTTLTYYSSGTTGTPKPIHYTEAEWNNGVAHRAECLSELGVRRGERAAVILPFGPWFSGDQLCDALMTLGANVLPVGHYAPHLPGAIQVMDRLEIDWVITTPSLAYTLPHDSMKPRHLILLGEHCPLSLRQCLAKRYRTAPRSIYAASEAIIGPDTESDPHRYVWNKERLHLEVLKEDGTITDNGTGQLLITRRHSVNRIYRYPLGDYVELSSSSVHFLGRVGHAFTLASGIKIKRRTLDSALDQLQAPISEARFVIQHQPDGDLLDVCLAGPTTISQDAFKKALLESSIELADALACGHVRLAVRHIYMEHRAKRHLCIEEFPWTL